MFKKILIANRGEIACRVIRTARRLGITTVAVYSDIDRHALHVEMADEAVHIGAAAATESYLCGEVIVQAALSTGADAIHPGYGFLSENADFVEQVTEAGICFIGPSADAIKAMGLKDAAKSLMQSAGVRVVPGYHGEQQESAFLQKQANEIGYPVLIKARSGGGGKGMRLVETDADFPDALASAQREAQSSFGDAHCLIEKFISSPRHIEIQVFGDSLGNVVHLFERDCSLQRRHQKVIEEAPAPGMTEEMRQAMGLAAIEAAKAINYCGAGTVEFIVDSADGLHPERFWFMEMNTRLQVEHPVTEAITGCDLVEWQLRVAAGEPLPLSQHELAIDGWALEARIYAEDVDKGFLPATGTLHHLQFPEDARVDTGVQSGDTLSPFYDPMIAKLIVHADSRDAVIDKMLQALRATHAAGSVTNTNFLASLVNHAAFRSGLVDTGLIERDIHTLIGAEPGGEILAVAAAAAANVSGSELSGFHLWQPLVHHVEIIDQHGQNHTACISVDNKGWAVKSADDVVYMVERDLNGLYSVSRHGDAKVQRADCVLHQSQISVFAERAWHFNLLDPLDAIKASVSLEDNIVAPMPGQIKVVNCAPGQTVSIGEPLIVLEAMKMEHSLTAPRDGLVQELPVTVGQQVEDGDLVLQLEPLSEAPD